jgi:hypothetical protein
MGVRVVVGAVLSAAALMVWSFMFWVVLSAPGGAMRPVPDEPALLQVLRDKLPVSATYYAPLPPQPQPGQDTAPALEAFRRRQMAGPIALIHFNREGADPLSTMTTVRSAAQALVSSLLAALLLLVALPALEGYAQRVVYVFGLGVFAAAAVRLSEPILWHLPWGHFLHGAMYDAVSWLVAGLVLAAIVKPPRGVVHLTDPSKPLWKRALDVD